MSIQNLNLSLGSVIESRQEMLQNEPSAVLRKGQVNADQMPTNIRLNQKKCGLSLCEVPYHINAQIQHHMDLLLLV